MSAADDLRALSAAATPGPWVVMRTGIISEAEAFSDVDDGDEYHFGSCTVIDDAVDHPEDAALIVWCRNHADALADLIDAARYIRTTGHGEKLTDMTTCRCGDPHPCPVLRTHDAIADLIDAAEALTQPAGWWTGVEQRQEHQLLDRRAVVRDALNALDALESNRG